MLELNKYHNITLTWKPNPELDIKGYQIYMNDTDAGTSGPYHLIHTLIGNTNQYNVTGLVEETTYYFMIAAYDEAPTNSSYSNIANATTLDETAPSLPTGLEATAISGTEIKLTWNSNPELDLAGYLIFMNDTDHGSTGKFHLIHIIIGSETSYTVPDLSDETTFYFKLKAFDEVPNNSSFSDVAVATTIDETPPSAPTGLSVSNTSYNQLTISWNANPEPDVIGYLLSRSFKITGPFTVINPIPITITQYNDTMVNELTTYYYQVHAIDHVDIVSDHSKIASGTTLIGPRAPEINNSLSNLEIVEDSIDKTSVNLYHWFKDVNGDYLTFRSMGEKHVNVTIYDENGTVVLRPEPNWNGKEIVSFYVSDGNYTISEDLTITVTPVNDPPGHAVISTPDNNSMFNDSKPLEFAAFCSDPDIIYGDILIYKWYFNVSGNMLIGNSLSDIILPIGDHMITLVVSDSKGETSSAIIYLSILETPDSDTDGDGMPDAWEREHGLDPNDPTDAGADPDNDGVPNIIEFTDDSDPQGLNDTPFIDKDDETSTKSSDLPPLWTILPFIVIILVVIIIIIVSFIFVQQKKKKRKFESMGITETEVLQPVEVYPPGQDALAKTGTELAQAQVVQSELLTSVPKQELITLVSGASIQEKLQLAQPPAQPPQLPPSQSQPIPVAQAPSRVENAVSDQQHQYQHQPLKGSKLSLQKKLELLEERLLNGELSEKTFLTLKAKYENDARPFEPSPQLLPPAISTEPEPVPISQPQTEMPLDQNTYLSQQSPEMQVQQQAIQQTEVQTVPCPACQNEIQVYSSSCPNCGSELNW